MGVEYITEATDNFRDPDARNKLTKEEEIINYLQTENQ